jgi:DNA-binding PadR family transcriptional regulator
MARRPLGYATVAILRAIDEDHRYGLDIIDATGLATGTVYVTLGRLQKRGFVETSWEDQRIADREGRPRRRYYRLSATGRDALQRALESYDALTSGAAAGSPRR